MSAIPLGKQVAYKQYDSFLKKIFLFFILVRQTASILLQGVPRSVPLKDVNNALLKVS